MEVIGMADECVHLVIRRDPGIPGLEWLGFVPRQFRSCELGLMDREGRNPWRPCEGCPGFESGDPTEIDEDEEGC